MATKEIQALAKILRPVIGAARHQQQLGFPTLKEVLTALDRFQQTQTQPVNGFSPFIFQSAKQAAHFKQPAGEAEFMLDWCACQKYLIQLTESLQISPLKNPRPVGKDKLEGPLETMRLHVLNSFGPLGESPYLGERRVIRWTQYKEYPLQAYLAAIRKHYNRAMDWNVFMKHPKRDEAPEGEQKNVVHEVTFYWDSTPMTRIKRFESYARGRELANALVAAIPEMVYHLVTGSTLLRLGGGLVFDVDCQPFAIGKSNCQYNSLNYIAGTLHAVRDFGFPGNLSAFYRKLEAEPDSIAA